MNITVNTFRTTYSKNDTKMSQELQDKILDCKVHKDLIELVKSDQRLKDGYKLQSYPEDVRTRVDLIKNIKKGIDTKLVVTKKGCFIHIEFVL